MTAEFVASAARLEDFPPERGLEIAFLGRSNVGKSSLLNTLAGQKGLAFTSNTPGRTQTVNFFQVDGKFQFVDLPGYGYARVPREIVEGWKVLVESYLLGRGNLALCILILDARRGWMEKDLELRSWLEFHRKRHLVVATKIDKLNQSERTRGLAAMRREAGASELMPFSAVTGQGVREIWQAICKTQNRT